MKLAHAVPLLALAALLGCVTTKPLTQSDALSITAKTFGEPRPTYILEVRNADNAISTAMMRAFLPSDAPIVTNVVSAIRLSNAKGGNLTVFGSDSGLTAQVIVAAFAQAPADLSRLQFLFVGDSEHAQQARTAVEAHGARFFFAPVPAAGAAR